ncbi:hypothetical protein [Agrobacterium pusense]|uniref:hypothetical protein n=1 Tax=Agrobacterium pusense TaxID=648995 RepID=UPI002FDCC8BE
MHCDHKAPLGQLCKCGSFVDGVLQDGKAASFPLIFKDNASISTEGKNIQMMTDSDRQVMKDSVRGMPLSKAAALPIYDNVRGLVTSGMPAERYFAILDGATVTAEEPLTAQIQAQAAYDHMVHRLGDAHRSATNDNKVEHRQFARDGRAMTTLTDREKADEAHQDYVDGLNAWRRDQ